MLLLLGGGVVANNILPKSKGAGTGALHINWGWGIAVFAGVLVAYKSGGHLNPAVTLGVVASGAKCFVGAPDAANVCMTAGPVVNGAATTITGITVNAASIFTYIGGQLLGAFIGAVLCWLAYKKQFDEEAAPAVKLGVFSTGPEVRSYGWNLVTEILGTFVLVFVVLASGHWGDSATKTPGGLGWLGALGVALLVVGIGASLGGPTGYAINPARDLGPRIAHAILPIPGKGGSDWSYSWVPVVGPIIGGVLAGLLSGVLLPK